MKHFQSSVTAILIVDLLATSGDVTLSWTSPMYPKLYSNDTSVNPLGRPISPDEDSWIGSLLNLGAIIGPYPYAIIAGKIGRRIALLAVALPQIISFLIMAFAKHIYLFYFARFLAGLAVGAGYSLLPMYIAEISRDDNRGAMSLTLNVFWAIGNFLPYVLGPFLTVYWFNTALAIIPITFLVLFTISVPESPYYLVEVGEIEKAEETIMLLRSLSKEEVQEELSSIKAYLKQTEDGNFWDIIKDKTLRKALLICLVLIVSQELSGFCAITYHLEPIFESASTNISADLSAFIVGFVLLISSFVAPFLVDRAGRKALIICSCLGMCLALTLLGIFFHIQDLNYCTKSINWIPIFSLMWYIVFFNLGICSVPWTLTSELFPNNVKQIASSTITSFCWVTSFTTTKTFNDMNQWIGKSGTFWVFAVSCLCCAIFSIFYVPETKGKSFSEIQNMLQSVKIREVEIDKKSGVIKDVEKGIYLN
nr:facilitated trehalose transporter Tret1-like [Leptinotarsa decemlineata]